MQNIISRHRVVGTSIVSGHDLVTKTLYLMTMTQDEKLKGPLSLQCVVVDADNEDDTE